MRLLPPITALPRARGQAGRQAGRRAAAAASAQAAQLQVPGRQAGRQAAQLQVPGRQAARQGSPSCAAGLTQEGAVLPTSWKHSSLAKWLQFFCSRW
jgi:hypothetical protein